VLSAHRVVKRFGSTLALAGVDLQVHAGEILGLVGANGAGKSTLISILSGAAEPTEGELRLDGAPVRFTGPADASRAGVSTVQQDVDQALVAGLTVAENLAFDRLVAGELGALPSGRRIRRAAREVLPDATPAELQRSVEELGTSQKQQLLIARALHHQARVIILDEPTAALSVREQRALRVQLLELAASGAAIVYISHHLGELTGLCDRVVVLRDGVVSGEFLAPLNTPAIVTAMLGPIAASQRAVAPDTGAEVMLEARGLRVHSGSQAIDFDIRDGEVLGITGLLGAGKSRLLRQLVGADRLVSGAIRIDGEDYRPRHPADAVSSGVGFVPEDRRSDAEIPEWDLASIVTLPDLRRYRRGGLLDVGRERRAAASIIETLRIVASGPRALITSLSGGNRQKVIVGRWIVAGSRLLVLDEPFRGIDLGARADIAGLLRSGQVRGVLVASSDPEEILEVADRILVLAEGRVVGELTPGSTDVESLAELMVAVPDDASATLLPPTLPSTSRSTDS
jgi:simple sugar transport system ATP-binding protein